jgi:hypothetical protein
MKKRVGSRDCRKKSKNRKKSPKIESFIDVNSKNSNFSENYDLLPWVQKSLLLLEIEESTCEREGELKIKLEKEREGELKIKLEKERVRGTEREIVNFFFKNKNKKWMNCKKEGEEE